VYGIIETDGLFKRQLQRQQAAGGRYIFLLDLAEES